MQTNITKIQALSKPHPHHNEITQHHRDNTITHVKEHKKLPTQFDTTLKYEHLNTSTILTQTHKHLQIEQNIPSNIVLNILNPNNVLQILVCQALNPNHQTIEIDINPLKCTELAAPRSNHYNKTQKRTKHQIILNSNNKRSNNLLLNKNHHLSAHNPKQHGITRQIQ